MLLSKLCNIEHKLTKFDKIEKASDLGLRVAKIKHIEFEKFVEIFSSKFNVETEKFSKAALQYVFEQVQN